MATRCRSETGTGKEVVARAIHFGESGAEDRPFIAISCPALPETLVESELFGHVKGTFTGASFSRPGCFELASGGTLFLDEIGDLSPVAQAKMLRVLETRAVRRLGDSHERPVDLRIVGATNADLHAQIKAGQFRADLFYRLQLFPIHIPPLRERPEDIIPLAMHFLQEFAQHYGKRFTGFSSPARRRLQGYYYPGNVRELRNLVERAAMLSREPIIDDLNLPISGPTSPCKQSDERQRILETLESCQWNRKQAAAKLGMGYSTLRNKIKLLALSN